MIKNAFIYQTDWPIETWHFFKAVIHLYSRHNYIYSVCSTLSHSKTQWGTCRTQEKQINGAMIEVMMMMMMMMIMGGGRERSVSGP